MFVTFILVALLALAATLALPAFVEIGPAARAHFTFAIGVMPLILAAFDYFVPVLTRSGASPGMVRALPWLALASGGLALIQFVAPGAVPMAPEAAALGALTAAGASAGWMYVRGARAVGPPHPCLDWYIAAALCLAVGTAAITAMPLWPEEYAALKRLHLHLNTLGFVGLAAISTLQVLMPTVAGRPDASVADRLHRDLVPAVAGVALIAAGAAWLAPLAWVGLALWLLPMMRLIAAWWQLYRADIFAWHGPAPALAGALAGMLILLAAGLLAPLFGSAMINSAFGFIAAFLLPLVTGAAGALLPVLLRPGVQTPWHAGFRETAGRYAGARALLFLLGGTAVALGRDEGIMLSLLALVLFVAQISRALRIDVK